MDILNPYKKAASLIYNRLKWDCNTEAWKSRKKLKKLKDNFNKEKAVILCNGPSLMETDFSLLNDIYTFGLNKINLLFDKVSFRPSSIVSVNPFVLQQNAEFFSTTDIRLFLDSEGYKYLGSRPEHITYLHSASYRKFAKDCSFSIDQGYTVTYVALELAFHMGFKKVALIGCDHNFVTQGKANKTVVAGDKDPNHFDPDYFSEGDKWQLPDLFESEISYQMAKEAYEEDHRTIYNATVGGDLEIFPRIELQEFLKKDL